MQLGNLDLLWLLILVPVGFGLGIVRRNRKERLLRAFADEMVLPALTVPQLERRKRDFRYAILLAILLGSIALCLLRPQWGFTWKEGTRRGVDIVFAVDVSDSMLAADVSPSRIERVRRKITDMLHILRGDRVALVSFAGVAFIETPLTLDYRAFRMFVDLVNTDLVPVQGSNVELAIMKSMEALGIKPENTTPPAHDSAILLFSDGEQLDGDVEKAISLAKANRVRIFTLGVGTPEGAPISMPSGYKKDPQGKVVITKMRPELLEKIAVETGGLFVQSVSSSKDLDAIYAQGIRRLLSTAELKGGAQKRWHEYFQLPLLLGVLLFLFGPWVDLAARLRRRSADSAGGSSVPVIPVAAGILVCLLLAAADPANAADPERLGAEAKRAFDGGNFDEALKRFEEAGGISTEDFRFVMGNGASYYRLNKFEEAQAKFAEAASRAKDNVDKAAALYNEANSLVQQGHYADAIKTYDESLTLNPSDQEAKDNRAYAKRLLEEQKQQQSNNKQDQQNKEKSDSNKDQKQESQSEKGDEQPEDQQKEKNSSNQQQQSSEPSEQEQKPDDTNKEDRGSGQSSSSAEPSPQPTTGGTGSSDDSSQANGSGEQQSSQPSSAPSDEATAQPSPQPSHEGRNSSNGPRADENKQTSEQSKASDASLGADEKGEQQPSASEASSDEATGNEELDSLLKGVEEKEGSRAQYRELKAKQELRALRQRLPERDW
ncbi:MAG: VWA domain-containing protein [Bdellovibrionota bacterium]